MGNEVARKIFALYTDMRDRGHRDFCLRAKRNIDFYMNEQWTEEAKAELAQRGLPSFTFNEITPGVNSAIGYQINNRMDMQAKPVGGQADSQKAEVISKVLMHECDRNNYQHIESDMFRNGLVTSRGFIDIRPCFSSGNTDGEIDMNLLDEMDVIPDPDSKSYDTKDWGKVCVTRWMSGDEIQRYYGLDKRREVEKLHPDGMEDWGFGEDGVSRMKFGESLGDYKVSGEAVELATKRYRVVDMQIRSITRKKCLILTSNDYAPVDSVSEERYAEMIAMGARVRPMDVDTIRWTVCTEDVVLWDEDSPLRDFSVIMFAPTFMRGRTVGMVDLAVSQQEAFNKAMSMSVHSINSSAQNVYLVEADSLHDSDVDDLVDIGSRAGAVIQYKKGSAMPVKVGPNPVPSGLDWVMTRSLQSIRNSTMPEAMTGSPGQEISGVAIKSKQFMAQQQLATALDNLGRTRRIVARVMLQMIQKYYSGNRIIRITEIDPATGKDVDKPLEINGQDPVTGGIMNDISVGKYDITVVSQPMKDTFSDGEFAQIMDMIGAGVPINPRYAVMHSNLTDKYDVLGDMAKQQAPSDPLAEVNVDLAKAKIDKLRADTAQVGAGTVYTLTQSAVGLVSNAGMVGAVDELAKSVGFVDKNGGQVMSQPAPGMVGIPIPGNQVNPALAPTPVSGMEGMNAGIETPQADMLR